jgi:hypothetical protein
MRSSAKFLLPILLGACCAGCATGVKWRYDFAAAYEDSRAQGKLTLVYFRQWFLPLCGRMEEQVLGDPRVSEATSDMNCVRYEMYAGDSLSAAWNVDATPTYLIVDTDGRILARRTGEFTVDDVLADIQIARTARRGGGP